MAQARDDITSGVAEAVLSENANIALDIASHTIGIIVATGKNIPYAKVVTGIIHDVAAFCEVLGKLDEAAVTLPGKIRQCDAIVQSMAQKVTREGTEKKTFEDVAKGFFKLLQKINAICHQWSRANFLQKVWRTSGYAKHLEELLKELETFRVDVLMAFDNAMAKQTTDSLDQIKRECARILSFADTILSEIRLEIAAELDKLRHQISEDHREDHVKLGKTIVQSVMKEIHKDLEGPESVMPHLMPPFYPALPHEEVRRGLHARLDKNRGIIVSVVGPTGSGKASCVYQFATEWKEVCPDKRFILWMTANSECALQKSFVDVQRALGGDADENGNVADLGNAIAEKLRSLSSKLEWLMVFDKAMPLDNLARMLHFGEETLKSGRTVIVSQSHDYCGDTQLGRIEPLFISPLNSDQALDMFLKLIDCADSIGDEMKEKAKRAIGRLGGLPRLIRIAAYEVCNRSTITTLPIDSLSEYLDELLSEKKTQVEQEASDLAKELQQCPQVSAILGYVNPFCIQKELIEQEGEKICEQLFQRSILVWSKGRGVFTLGEHYQAEIRAIHGSCIQAVSAVQRRLDAFDRFDKTTWQAAADMIPHVEWMKPFFDEVTSEESDTDKLAIGQILKSCSNVIMRVHNDNERARTMLELALRYADASTNVEAKFGLIGDILAHLGVVHLQAEQYDLAEASLRNALSFFESVNDRGLYDEDIAFTMNRIGGSLEIRGDIAGANAEYERALAKMGVVWESAERLPNALDSGQSLEDPTFNERKLANRYASILNNLGNIWFQKGHYQEALANLDQSIAVYQTCFGETLQNPDLAEAIMNRYSLDPFCDPILAKCNLEYALKKFQSVYGENADERAVAVALNNLGEISSRCGDDEYAERKLEEALIMYKRLHLVSYIPETLMNLSDLYRKTKQFYLSQTKLKQAKKLLQRNKTPPPLELAGVYYLEGRLAHSEGDDFAAAHKSDEAECCYDEAQEKYNLAQETLESVLGDDAKRTVKWKCAQAGLEALRHIS